MRVCAIPLGGGNADGTHSLDLSSYLQEDPEAAFITIRSDPFSLGRTALDLRRNAGAQILHAKHDGGRKSLGAYFVFNPASRQLACRLYSSGWGSGGPRLVIEGIDLEVKLACPPLEQFTRGTYVKPQLVL